MTKIEEAITEWFGERCPDTYPGCPCCDAWAEYDALIANKGKPIPAVQEGRRALNGNHE